MEAKWPFLILTIALLSALGVMIASIDRVQIMNNWTEHRCEVPIMFAGSFFKPEDDPRSKSAFASDNFEFCMKKRVDQIMEIMMAPVTALFSKQVSVTGNTVNSMNVMRRLMNTMFDAFSGYFDKFYRRFNASVFEISKVVQFLRMALRRVSGIMMSFIYTGLSIFNGMVSSIQVVVKVILIICTILLVLMILLFFVLFPVIPFIISTLVGIVAAVVAFVGIMDAELAAAANSKKSGFCFAEWTQVTVIENGLEIQKLVSDLKVGDQIVDGAVITATIEMDGADVRLYQVGDVFVSGSHLIKGTDQVWKSVTMDERAVASNRTSDRVYCFNTTTNVITINGLQFRDWEEIANDDSKGQLIWNYMVSSIINKNKPFQVWKDNLKDYVNNALIGPDVRVKTPNGFVPIRMIQIGDCIVDKDGLLQEVRGIICGQVLTSEVDTAEVDTAEVDTAEVDTAEVSMGDWKTELYEYDTAASAWIKGQASLSYGDKMIEGRSLITEDGEFVILDPVQKKEVAIRDFTEVGYHAIHLTYPYVDARLRIKE